MFECTKTVLYLNGIRISNNLEPSVDDSINSTPQKCLNEGIAISTAIFIGGKLGINFISSLCDNLVNYDGNLHNSKDPITSVKAEENNTNLNEVQTLSTEDSLSGIVAHPIDHLPLF